MQHVEPAAQQLRELPANNAILIVVAQVNDRSPICGVRVIAQ